MKKKMNKAAKQERLKMRQHFFDAFDKKHEGDPLSALEQQLSDIIVQHPEYHYILKDPKTYLEHDYEPMEASTNPFFHMALHASLMEQITTDRPKGILEIYKTLASKTSNSHEAEHSMMTILAATLWQAQQTGSAPKESEYLKLLQKLIE
ncbi:MAG: DUF1841 family protein [Coxiellaceae bacterium]|nr:DUF1841 family protein [Coxiellaceae bacterium]